MMIAIFRLPNFPVGTLIGVLIVWYLLQEKVLHSLAVSRLWSSFGCITVL